MRDLIKSTLRFSWAMSLFGVQQLENVGEDSRERNDRTAGAFEKVTEASEEQLTGVIKNAFKAGDELQSGVVDMILGGLPGQGQSAGSTASPVAAQPGPQGAPVSAGPTKEMYPVTNGQLDTTKFVVLGEGLAAGMGDFTLTAETQVDSFPAQMARQMQAQFPQRLIQAPGIGNPAGFATIPVIVPAPMQTSVLDQLPPAPINNLSVPVQRLADALNLRPCQPLIQRNDDRQTAVNLILGVSAIAYG